MSSFEATCTQKCQSIEHGNIITSAISSLSNTDTELSTFLAYTCQNCQSVRDSVGRTALHVAASWGRTELVKWLIETRHAGINVKDHESGCTALHRSLFYGRIHTAVELIKLGASLTVPDECQLTALDHIMLDKPSDVAASESAEILAWGRNSNNVFGAQPPRSQPDPMDLFHKKYEHTEVTSIQLNQFHSLIQTETDAYACGHGQGGRLGLGSQLSQFVPQRITCLDGMLSVHECASGRDHSIFKSDSQEVFACGINKHKVLGYLPPPVELLYPEKLGFDRYHVGADDYHSYVWSENGLFTWGLNGGQLGHNHTTDPYIVYPTLVDSFKLNSIKAVVSNNCAIVVQRTNGEIIVLANKKIKTIGYQVPEVQIAVSGGRLHQNVDPEISKHDKELQIFVCSTKSFYVWRESDPILRMVKFNAREIHVKQMSVNMHHLLFTTIDGRAFEADLNQELRTHKALTLTWQHVGFCRPLTFNIVKDIADRYEAILMKVKRIPRIYGARSIVSDPQGHNFAVIRTHRSIHYELFFPYDEKVDVDECMLELLETTEKDDGICDVVFQVDNTFIPAHKYVLAHNSQDFAELFERNPMKMITINSQSKEEFLKTLKQTYINYSRSPNFVEDRRLEQIQFPEYTDVEIVCADGHVLKAHKCMLSASLEYYQKMFSTRWDGKSTQRITIHYSKPVVEIFLDFVYHRPVFDYRSEDIDTICNVIILADEVIWERLKLRHELILSWKIGAKNCARILDFAVMYNCKYLTPCCFTFMEQNLAYLLECGYLDNLNSKSLMLFSEQYQCLHSNRTLPHTTELTDEIRRIAMEYPKQYEEKPRRKRTKSTKLSVSSEKSLSESADFHVSIQNVDERLEDGVDIRSPIADRLPGILKANEEGRVEVGRQGDMEVLRKSWESGSAEFPDLSSSTRSPNETRGRPVKGDIRKKTIVKLSQKERKRLSSESMTSESTDNNLTKSPKNPWKLPEPLVSPDNSIDSTSFQQILTFEKKEKENLTKLLDKQFIYTQMEDRAIEELKKFYNSDNLDDEVIVIDRVPAAVKMTSPIWVPNVNSIKSKW